MVNGQPGGRGKDDDIRAPGGVISSGDDGGGDGGQGGAGTSIGGEDGEGYSRALNGGGGGGSAGRIRLNATVTLNVAGTLSPESASGGCSQGLPPFQPGAPETTSPGGEMALSGCRSGGPGGLWLVLLLLLGRAIRRRPGPGIKGRSDRS